MTATPDGTLVLIDNGDLRRVSPDGKVATVAVKLSEHDPAPANLRDRHYHMGLWTDGAGHVYQRVLASSSCGSSPAGGRRGLGDKAGVTGLESRAARPPPARLRTR